MRNLIYLSIFWCCFEAQAGFAPSHSTRPTQSDSQPSKRPIAEPVAGREEELKKAQAQLTQFLKSQLADIDETLRDQIRSLMRNLDDPEKLLEALNSLFFDNQLSVSAEGIEEEVFGQKLAEFSNLKDRHVLVKAYTEGQKEYRDQLLTKISEALGEMNDLQAIKLSKALIKAKEKHLEAYDRVIKNIPETDGKDSWCFTCNPTGEIGEGTGYTYEKAMNEAISQVMKDVSFNEAPQPQQPKPQAPVKPQQLQKIPSQKPPTRPQSPPSSQSRPQARPQQFLPDHSRLQVPGLSSQGSQVPSELRGPIANLLRGKQVLLLGNPTGCPPCQRAAAFLRQRGVPFEEAPVRSNAEAGQLFRSLRGQKFPLMIHSDGKGGFKVRQPNW